MAKKSTRQKLVSRLDTVFSQYVRHRDSVDGMCTCSTCGVVKPIKEMQAGHFMSRRKRSTRWDEMNVHAQCAGCNMWNQGRQYEMSIYIDQKYGDGTSDKLLQQSNQTYNHTNEELQVLINNYKEGLK